MQKILTSKRRHLVEYGTSEGVICKRCRKRGSEIGMICVNVGGATGSKVTVELKPLVTSRNAYLASIPCSGQSTEAYDTEIISH